MPIAITLATIALLRGGSSPQPFFDPEVLREMLEDGLDEADDVAMEASLAIVEELEAKQVRYRDSIEATLDAYTEESANPDTRAADLIERLEPLDQQRREMVMAVIDSRQHLKQVLDEEQWDQVFD